MKTSCIGLLVLAGLAAGCARTAKPAPAPAGFEDAARHLDSGSDPAIAVRDTGYLFLLHPDGGNLWFQISTDGGDSFAAPIRVNDVAGEVMSHPEASPKLVQRAGKAYALWAADQGGAAGRMMMKLRFARSTDYGVSFNKAIDVDPAGPAEQSFFNLFIAPNGDIYAVWLDGRDKKQLPDGASVYLARSTDGGASFLPSVRAATNACPCCRPALAFDGNTVYVGYRRLFGNDVRDTAVAVSSDNGQNWSPPYRVAMDEWRLDGCPHSGPSLAVLDHRLFISWYTVHQKALHAAVYIASSNDRGRSYSPEEELSTGTVDANHPVLVTAGNRLLAAFQGRNPTTNNGWGRIHPYLRVISADGKLSPLMSVADVSASAVYPDLAFEAPAHIFLAWTESGAGDGGVSFIRGRLLPETR